jgi:hypothetical protein
VVWSPPQRCRKCLSSIECYLTRPCCRVGPFLFFPEQPCGSITPISCFRYTFCGLESKTYHLPPLLLHFLPLHSPFALPFAPFIFHHFLSFDLPLQSHFALPLAITFLHFLLFLPLQTRKHGWGLSGRSFSLRLPPSVI